MWCQARILPAAVPYLPPPGYWQAVREACTAHGTLLIFDEIPTGLGKTGRFFAAEHDAVAPDIVVLKCRSMDADGWFNLSASNLWHRAIVERARTVIVEVNDALPYCHGVDNGIHVSEVDVVIDGDGQPTPELPATPVTDVDRAVGRLIAAEIDVVVRRIAVLVDVQIGIGQVGILDHFNLFLLDFFIRNRLLRLQHWLGMPGIAAFDASDGIVLAQVVKAGAALRAAVLGAPFSLDHVNSSMLPFATATG